MFHTDRGKEFDNKLITEALETFGIQRSLCMKVCRLFNPSGIQTTASTCAIIISSFFFL